MKNVTESTVNLKHGETLFYRFRKGGKHTLLLLHGNMSSSANFDVILDEFDQDFSVYAIDQRGFGKSSYEKPADQMAHYAKDVKAFCEAMNIKRCHLLGWSFGGNVAMQVAIDYPDLVEKLVLCASGSLSGFPVEKKRFFGFISTGRYLSTKAEIAKSVKPLENIRAKRKRSILKLVMFKSLYTNERPSDESYQRYEEAFFQQRNLVDVNYALAHFNISELHNGVVEGNKAMHKLTLPVLILHGKQDKIVPPSVAEAIDYYLKNTTLKVYEEASHALFNDAPALVAKDISDFLKA